MHNTEWLLSSRETDSPGVYSAEFWAQAWNEVRTSSAIHQTQRSAPDGWLRFYDAVSSYWLDMLGEGLDLGKRVAEVLLKEGLVMPEGTVLDVGCGPGALSLALAEGGIAVKAVDNSRGMIVSVERAARRMGFSNLEAQCVSWEDLPPLPVYDLVAAAFFPQALHPGGIERMESLSGGSCALILGTGVDSLPFRRELWGRLIQAPQPSPGRHLVCAVNYLLATGRAPCVKHLDWPFTFDVQAQTVRSYFREYFALFGKPKAEIETAVELVLAPYVEGERIHAEGQHSLAVVWWKKPVPHDPVSQNGSRWRAG